MQRHRVSVRCAAALLGILGVLGGVPGCGPAGGADLLVQVANIPIPAKYLRVAVTLGERPAQPEEFQHAAGMYARLGLRIPEDGIGNTHIQVEALDADRCSVARGRIDWEAGDWSFASGTRAVDVDLYALHEKRCTCPSDGWCFENPLPADTVRPDDGYGGAVWGSAENDIWLGGFIGRGYHWNGEVWTQVPTGIGSTIAGLWGSASDDVWAVTYSVAQSYHFNGGSWQYIPTGQVSTSDAPRAIYSLWGTAKDDIWAIGKNTVIHWNGTGWSANQTVFSASYVYNLTKISGISKNDVWIVGSRTTAVASTSEGVVLHFDGKNFVSVPLSDAAVGIEEFTGVFAAASNNVWFSGKKMGKGVILRWDGSKWLDMKLPNLQTNSSDNFFLALGVSETDIWVYFQSQTNFFYHWDGNRWIWQAGGPWRSLYGNLWRSNTGNIWAVGIDAPFGTAAYRWDGVRWQQTVVGTERTLHDLYGSGSEPTWAAGVRTLMHWTGTAWVEDRWDPSVVGSYDHLYGLWGAQPNDVWGVGWGFCSCTQNDGSPGDTSMIVHWNGTDWNIYTIDGLPNNPTRSALYAVSGSGAYDIWAVGAAGAIVHWDGVTWSAVPSGLDSSISLFDVYARSRDEAWAVGDKGTLLKWDGRRWSPAASGTGAHLKSIWGSATGPIWVVGQHGAMLRWDDSRWVSVNSGTTNDLMRIRGNQEKNIWAVGENGTALHFDGQSWQSSYVGTKQQMNAVWSSGPYENWVAGDHELILRKRP